MLKRNMSTVHMCYYKDDATAHILIIENMASAQKVSYFQLLRIHLGHGGG